MTISATSNTTDSTIGVTSKATAAQQNTRLQFVPKASLAADEIAGPHTTS